MADIFGIRDRIMRLLEDHDRCPPQSRDYTRREKTAILIMQETRQTEAATPSSNSLVTPEVAARVLYDNWSGLASLPSPARELACRGHFFSALRLLFEPDADLTKPPKAVPQPNVAGIWQREHEALGELIRLLDEEPSIGGAEMAGALEKARCAWDHSRIPAPETMKGATQ